MTGAKTYIGKGDEDTVSGRDGLPFSLRDDFIKSIEKVYNAPAELHIGNHLGDNKHNEKTTHLGEEKNPFLDGSTWKWFLDMRKAEALELFEKDK